MIFVVLNTMKGAVLIALMLFFASFQRTHSVDHNATVGDDVLIPCGINAVGNVSKLVWKIGQSASNSQQLAIVVSGTGDCDRTRKNCDLNDRGDLVLHNVQERDSDVHYFCFLNDEMYFAEHALNICPVVPPPTFGDCPESNAVFISKLDDSSQMLLAYTTPTCRNSNDNFGRVTCDPPSGAKIESGPTQVVCNCTYFGDHSDTCKMPIPALPPTFEDCPKSINVSVSKLEESSLMALAYTTPVCRNSRDTFGRVICRPEAGAHIYNNLTKIVCSCTYSGGQSDTCEIPIPEADCIVPAYAGRFAGCFFAGVGFMIIIDIVVVAYYANRVKMCNAEQTNELEAMSRQNYRNQHQDRRHGDGVY